MTTKQPGTFEALCRQARWVPLSEMLALPREQQPDTTQTRWDSKQRCEVALVECAFSTTDRAAFELHMKTLHRKRPLSGASETLIKEVRRGWRGPRLFEEGRPWVDPSRRTNHSFTQTCGRCGLVAEVGDRLADQRWWDEHLELCVGVQSAEAGAA